MTEERFWSIVVLGDVEQDDASAAVDELTRANVEEIFAFEDLLAEKVHALDGWRFARAWDPDSYARGWVSPDSFLLARCAAVGRGQKFFESVLRDPERLAAVGEAGFEELLFVAEWAYEDKTGEEFRHEAALGFETYSNDAGWANPEGLPDEAVSDLDDTFELLYETLYAAEPAGDRPSLAEFSEAFLFVSRFQREADGHVDYAEIQAAAEERGIRIPDALLNDSASQP